MVDRKTSICMFRASNGLMFLVPNTKSVNRGAKRPALLICFLWTVFALPLSASGQGVGLEGTPEASQDLPLHEAKERAARMMDSDEIREQAWGAYLAGERGLRDFIPSLRRLLARKKDPDEHQLHCLRLVVLDSLIRLNATVSAKELLSLFEDCPEQVIVLLANSPAENSDALLALARSTQRGFRWVAVCNLLAEMKTPGFAALMLKELKIHARVYVLESAGRSPGIGGGELWGSVACGVWGAKPSFPPVAHYKFEDHPKRGAVVLSVGKRTIYYQRLLVSGTRQQGYCRPDSGGNCDQERADYLAALFETSRDQLGIDPQPSFAVVWSEPEQFRSEVEGMRKDIKKKYGDLTARLIASGLLSENETASLKPQVSITVVDSRENTSTPLPEIEQ